MLTRLYTNVVHSTMWDGLVLLFDGDKYCSEIYFKEERRQRLLAVDVKSTSTCVRGDVVHVCMYVCILRRMAELPFAIPALQLPLPPPVAFSGIQYSATLVMTSNWCPCCCRQHHCFLYSRQVMNDQRLALYRARDEVIGKEQDGLRELALEYSAKTCTEIVQG